MPLVALVREAAALGREALELVVLLVREIRGSGAQLEAVRMARRAVAEVAHAATQRAAAAALGKLKR